MLQECIHVPHCMYGIVCFLQLDRSLRDLCFIHYWFSGWTVVSGVHRTQERFPERTDDKCVLAMIQTRMCVPSTPCPLTSGSSLRALRAIKRYPHKFLPPKPRPCSSRGVCRPSTPGFHGNHFRSGDSPRPRWTALRGLCSAKALPLPAQAMHRAVGRLPAPSNCRALGCKAGFP